MKNIWKLFYLVSNIPTDRHPDGWQESYAGVTSKGKLEVHFFGGRSRGMWDSFGGLRTKSVSPDFILEKFRGHYHLTWEQVVRVFRSVRVDQRPITICHPFDCCEYFGFSDMRWLEQDWKSYQAEIERACGRTKKRAEK